MDLTIEDVKALVFELFMAQRETAQLRARVAELEAKLAGADRAEPATR